MKIKISLILILFIGVMSYSQISFTACDGLFDSQTFTFNNVGDDGNGRNIFETILITGDQPCSGIGTCEFRMSWDDTAMQWEFIADDGTGDFSSPFLIYTNSEASLPNPPSLNLGTWVENSGDTGGGCGGNLTTSNSTMTGDVQDTVLSTDTIINQSSLSVFPNPAKNQMFFSGVAVNEILNISIYNILGERVYNNKPNTNSIDVSQLKTGIYFLKLQFENIVIKKKIVIQ